MWPRRWVWPQRWAWPRLRAQGEALTLELLRQKPAATVTLCLCLVNSACAILSVVPSTHCVSCTIQCEETGSHFFSRSGRLKIFGTRRNARGVSVRVREVGGKVEGSIAELLLSKESFFFIFPSRRCHLFCLSHTLIRPNLLAPKL